MYVHMPVLLGGMWVGVGVTTGLIEDTEIYDQKR
jgi:hypothetical protein